MLDEKLFSHELTFVTFGFCCFLSDFQEPKQQTSVLETKTSLTDHSSHDASNKDAVVTQVKK